MTDKEKRRVFRILFAAATVLFAVSLMVCVRTRSGRLELYLPEGSRVSDFRPENGLVSLREVPGHERRMTVEAAGQGIGPVFIDNTNPEVYTGLLYVRVLPGGMIYDMTNGNFSGSREVSAVIQIYVLTLAVLAAASFVTRVRGDLYSYSTLYMGGMAIFLAGLAAGKWREHLLWILLFIAVFLAINLLMPM